ncbi:MAG: phosphonopyruvate decarboxylase [Akkermansiaceae bacterium]|nr:phosphonopyruvate decarboxylase [Akkermansiaceae bacterium]
MIDCAHFLNTLTAHGIGFYAGVPDSLLKHFCAYLDQNVASENHVIAANEGGAVALASGHYLATGKPGLVYLQNSGLGNCVNPLLSLADKQVYSIPMLLMIGWRGEPGHADEPQHIKQGAVTLQLLESLGVPYEVLPREEEPALELVRKLVEQSVAERSPVALVVRKDTFSRFPANPQQDAVRTDPNLTLGREQALQALLDRLGPDVAVVSSTGMISREVFECRAKNKLGHHQDFLTVGSMGHCSQIAYGVANANPAIEVCCIDGDGAAIMHMGAMAILGQYRGGNLIHVVINNGRHDSVGGQPTAAFDISLSGIASACGYEKSFTASTLEEMHAALDLMTTERAMAFLEIKVLPGSRPDLGRPTLSPAENKESFMNHCRTR